MQLTTAQDDPRHLGDRASRKVFTDLLERDQVVSGDVVQPHADRLQGVLIGQNLRSLLKRRALIHVHQRRVLWISRPRRSRKPVDCGPPRREPPPGCMTFCDAAAGRLRDRQRLAEEVAALEADADDRALMRDVADLMEDLRAPW